MICKTRFLSCIGLALMASGFLNARAAETPYYNPANPASPTGKTTGYELYRTIGCPGQGILGTDCGKAPEAKPVAAVKPAPKPEPKPEPLPKAVTPMDPWMHSFLYVPTGMRETSGLMVERLIPREVVAGQPFDYILRVTNLTPSSLKDVFIQDVCGDDFALESSTPEVDQFTGNKLQWDLGEMQGGESRDITVHGSFPAGAAAKSCVSASYDQASCQAFNVVEPKLNLTVTAPAEVMRCEPIPVHYVVSNPGNGASKAASLTQNTPQGLSSKDGSLMGVTALGDLAPGASRSLDAVFTAAATGTYEFKPVASASPELKAEASASTKVTQPVLEVAQSGREEVLLGHEVPYTITLSNKGDAVARDVMVEEDLPAGANLASASDAGKAEAGKVVWHLPDLKPGETKEVSMALSVGSTGMVEGNVRASAQCAETALASAKTDVKGIPAVLLEVVDVTDPVEVGKTTTYVITATNQGSATDVNLRIKAVLEDSMALVSADGATAGTASGETVQFAPLPTLAPGAQAVWKVTVKAVKPADARFFVEMSSDLRSRPVEETEATTLYQ
jgi:uncharacterized repeat protein (TIGR01451 family)